MEVSCKICGQPVNHALDATVLNKYQAVYYHCDNCGFLFPDQINWLEQAYINPINLSDTGYITRNVQLSRRTFLLFYLLFGKKFNYLDYAGGFGVLTRLMRDYGLNFFWEDKYTKNIFASGFEQNDKTIKAVTCFECFEHFKDPMSEIEKMIAISKNIFFSTELIKNNTVPEKDWNYFGFEHGQHIAFYSIDTLRYIAKKYQLHLYSNGTSLHFFTEKKINPLMFKILLKFGALPWDMFAKFLLKGKTLADSRLIIENNGDN